MTEVERMIYENCRNVGNIKIRCDYCKFVEDCVDYGWEGCKKFTPAPSEPMTNGEYIKSLNTEQLAEAITDIVYECKEQDDCMDCKLGWCSKDYVVKWLKEKHNE